MPRYYTTDTRKLTFRECWNLSRSLAVLILWVLKVLRVRLDSGIGMPYPESLRDWEISEDEMTRRAQGRMADEVAELLPLGFHSPFSYTYKDALMPSDVFATALLHESGTVFAVVMYGLDRAVHPAKEQCFSTIVSWREDDTFIATTTKREELLATPGDDVLRLAGASSEQLLEAHSRVLAETSDTRQIQPVQTTDALIDAVECNEQNEFDFNIGRGLFAELTEAQVRTARARFGKRKAKPVVKRKPPAETGNGASVEAYDDVNGDDDFEDEPVFEVEEIFDEDGESLDEVDEFSENAEVLAEIASMEQKKSGWAKGLIILAVSIALFVGIGAANWSLKFVVMLIPVLLFHELGHYVTMRVFKYRNLKMFFIPLLGAAVSGRHYNVPGWKKAVVSLMGPVPGIVLGSVLGIVGLVTDHSLLIEVSALTLFLNAFNLLPILPLDGGWVLHAVVFSRHYVLDVVFRGGAAALLALAGFLIPGQDWFLIALGFMFFMGLPGAYRVARIADGLRKRGFSAASSDNETIPPASANVILNEVKQAFPGNLPNKIAATHTVQIFETLNARPPGIGASLALLAVHVGSFIAAGIMGVVLAIALSIPGEAPEYPLQCGTTQQWSGPALVVDDLQERDTLVASFDDAPQAREHYDAYTAELPHDATMTLLGQTLLIEIPSDPAATFQTWKDKLEDDDAEVGVQQGDRLLSFRVRCVAPDDETEERIIREFEQHLAKHDEMHLIPPWLPDDPRTPEEQQAHRRARETYAKLIETEHSDEDAAALREIRKRMDETWSNDDKQARTKLMKEHAQRFDQADRNYYDSLRDAGPEQVDLELIDLYEKYLEQKEEEEGDESNELRKLIVELSERMGRVPDKGNAPLPSVHRYTAQGGWADWGDLALELEVWGLHRPAAGTAALVEWLCKQECVDLKYSFEFPDDEF